MKTRRPLMILLCSLLLASTPYSLANKNITQAMRHEITEANWRTHPQIQAVRQTVTAINAAIKRREFKRSERKLDCGGGDDLGFVLKRLARGKNGVARWFQEYSQGQDASWDFYYYYDEDGRVRFVFALARAANGTREQLRIYFDETGKRIWQRRNLQGPGCPGCFSSYYDSNDSIVFEPIKEFASDGKCKVVKS